VVSIGTLYTAGGAILTGAGAVDVAVHWGPGMTGSVEMLGWVFLVLGGATLMNAPMISRRADIAGSYEAGYDAGFHQGRRAKPVVVPFRKGA
jgi:hypothetical protein